jgi:hypothetical protein
MHFREQIQNKRSATHHFPLKYLIFEHSYQSSSFSFFAAIFLKKFQHTILKSFSHKIAKKGRRNLEQDIGTFFVQQHLPKQKIQQGFLLSFFSR